MTKQREVKSFPWGKKSIITVTTTKDDETGVETLELYAKRGRSVTRAKIERDMASGVILRLNGTPMPMPSDESLYAKLSRAAAQGVAAMADRDNDDPGAQKRQSVGSTPLYMLEKSETPAPERNKLLDGFKLLERRGSTDTTRRGRAAG